MFDLNDTESDLISFFIEQGGKTELRDEMQVIKSYESPEEESFSLHNGVGLRYLNTSGILELKGTDSIDFLHRISTNTINGLKKEDVRKTIFTSEKGRIIGVSTVINFESYLLLVSSLKSQPKVMSWLNKYVIADDVKVSDATHRFNIFEIRGPQSQSFLAFTCGETINDVPENSFKVISSEEMLFFLAKIKNHNNNVKYWILADQANGKKLITYMLENKGPYDFNLIGEDAFNAYRIEMGIPSDPNELNDLYNPLESGLNYLIDFKKGCYIGQEVIARLETYDKVQRNLMGICFSDDINANGNFLLLDSKKNEIGTVTSFAYSPRIKKNIGMGYVKKDVAQNGNKVVAKNGTKEVEVTLTELPFKK